MKKNKDLAGRAKFIKENKDEDEIPIRLYEMQFVKGKLPVPVERAFIEYRKADAEWQKADAEWRKVIIIYKTEIEALHKKEVPDSCWDGKELDFTKSKLKGE